ncbi:TolC family protein, partial [Pseudomonas syringae]|uniref:TolC family protein n=1 Tax=Pseudomonas syringae TaxID=317 RepID=UPI001F401340
MTERLAFTSRPTGLIRPFALGLCVVLLSACAVGPDYQKPSMAAPAQFKAAQGWRTATPSDGMAKGAWWEVYKDPQLNALVERLNTSNQTVAQYDAQYRQAQTLVRSSRAAFLPTLDLTTGKTRSGQGTGTSNSGTSASGIRNSYNAQLGVSWEADVWGKLRRGLEADTANAQASLADLAAMRLSLQSELVQNYLQLRVIDEQKRLLESTVDAYQRSLTLTQNQYRASISGSDAVAQAQTQLKSTQADLIDLAW